MTKNSNIKWPLLKEEKKDNCLFDSKSKLKLSSEIRKRSVLRSEDKNINLNNLTVNLQGEWKVNKKFERNSNFSNVLDLFFRLVYALNEINEGMSQRKAALKFNIPKTTLQNHLRIPEQRIGKGQVPVLSSDEESKVVDWIIESAKRGNPKIHLMF